MLIIFRLYSTAVIHKTLVENKKRILQELSQ